MTNANSVLLLCMLCRHRQYEKLKYGTVIWWTTMMDCDLKPCFNISSARHVDVIVIVIIGRYLYIIIKEFSYDKARNFINCNKSVAWEHKMKTSFWASHRPYTTIHKTTNANTVYSAHACPPPASFWWLSTDKPGWVKLVAYYINIAYSTMMVTHLRINWAQHGLTLLIKTTSKLQPWDNKLISYTFMLSYFSSLHHAL